MLALSLLAAAAAPIPCPSASCYTPADASDFNATAFAAFLLAQPSPAALRVAPGTYSLPRGSDRAHLVLPPLSQVHLDMTAVTLVAGDRAGPGVYVSAWVNSTLTGLTLRYAAPPSSTSVVTALGASTVDVEVEAGYPLEDFVAGTVASCNLFSSATRLRKYLASDLYVTAVAPLGGPAFRLTLANAGQLAGIAPGDLLGCRVPNGGMTMNVDGAQGCTFSNVALYGGPCFGWLESGGVGGNAYLNISIRYPDPPAGALHSPLLSTSADGFHSAGVRQGPRIEGAVFEGMDDDGIAIHGGFMLVTSADASSGRVWMTAHGALAVGDRVLFYDPTFAPAPAPTPPSFSPTFYTVLALQPAPHSYTPPFNVSHTMPSQKLPAPIVLLTLGGLPPGLTFDWVAVNADAVGAGYVLRGNVIRNHRARGMLLKGSNGLVQGNSITNSSLGGIIITPELYWEEASFSRNVTVIDNVVTLTSSGIQSYGGLALGAIAPNGRLAVAAPGHVGIALLNNTIIDSGYSPIWLNAGGNVTLRGNRVIRPFPAASAAGLPRCCLPLPQQIAVYAQGVQGLVVEGNCVQPAAAGQSSLLYLLNVSSDCSGVWEGGVTLC